MKTWINRWRQDAKPKASIAAPLLITSGGRAPIWTPRQYDKLAEEGYQKNIIVYRCVSLISRSVASVPWQLHKKETPLGNHPLLTLLQVPNPQQSLPRFMEALTAYLLLAGNAYVEATFSEKVPLELYLLRPDRMRVIPSPSGIPEAYEYTLKGQKVTIPVDPLGGRSHLLHMRMFHPLNDWYGMSPIEAAAHAIDQHNAVATHNLALLQNGGRPSGALEVKLNAGESLSEEQRTRIKDELHQAYEGASNAGRVMILEGNFDWKEMGLSLKDLDFIEGKNLSAREIAQVYGVPPMLVGVPGDATFSNYKEARYHLWEDTILPYLEMIKSELNRWLVPYYEDKLMLSYNTDAIPALAPKREALWDKIEKASFLTLNEKRELLGYPPLPFGNSLQSSGEKAKLSHPMN